MKYIFTIVSIFVFAATIFAQNVFKDLKSLEKRADRYYNEMSYVTAIELYKQALAKPKKSSSSSIRVKIAKSYVKTGQSDEAEAYYRQALAKGFKPARRDSTQFARILISNNKYQEAKLWMSNIANKESDPSGFEQYKSISQLPTLYRDSFSFSVKSIIYNSAYSDYSPVFYKNGIVFSSDRPSQKLVRQVNTQKDAGFSELYFFKERDSIQRPAQPINLDFKSPLHKGPAIFYDNGTKMMLTANALKAGVSHLQLFTADWDDKNKEWTNFQPFPFNSDFYSIGHPAMSKDERSLYFVSDMPGGNGGSDIYITVLKDGEWTKPKNLREPVNTEGNEMFPYISPSGKFYFASDGHGGLGGMDIVYTDNNNFQNEQEIINSGYPLNSSGDDFGIILDNQEKSGYFSSNRKGGKGQDDIYKLFIKKVELKLKVADEIASATVANPTVKLIDTELETEIFPSTVNTKDNVYKYVLKPHHRYKIAVQKEDYKGVEKDISTMEIDDDQLIEVKTILKRKFEYYVTLKIRDTETENIVENSIIQVLNLTNNEIDSIGVNRKGEADIKLDSEADYLILAFKNNMKGQIKVEKQSKKKVSSVRFITLNISEQKEDKVVWQVLDSLETKILQPEELIVRDMVTEEEKVVTTENGLLQFTGKDSWHYRIYYHNREFYYDTLKKSGTGNLRFKMQ